MKIYNTAHKKIQKITSQNKTIRLYTCGPTVYDYVHIGNLRTFVFEDIFKRALLLNGFSVIQVMNITDVDDKTIKKSKADKKRLVQLGKKYTDAFLMDIKKLNIIQPDKMPKATDYIDQMVIFIKKLIDKNIAYRGEDGSIYYSISKFKNYGKLSKLPKEELKDGVRVSNDQYDKENPADFVLWKAWSKNDGDIYWQTSLGKGRPGWHIECSVMSNECLGKNIDIHAGGVDLIFPHHENEIAQSEPILGKNFVKYWVHAEHLMVNGKKMSKSLGNFYNLADLEKKGFSPLDFRYLCLQAHYRSKLNFTWDALKAAKNARNRLKRITLDISGTGDGMKILNQGLNSKIEEAKKKISDDLNSPEFLAYIWDQLRDEAVSNKVKAELLKWADDKILTLDLFKKEEQIIPEKISKLLKEREQARKNKNFQLADELKKEIERGGYEIRDKNKGTEISLK